ncbi:serine--tRNA ligase [Candidatus Peregrinibacteria bacterium]|nr:serine--tRNA ligase [Candidatus Peregrinibacteria bacterium]
MLDPKFIRENAEYVKKIIESGRSKPEMANVEQWLFLDKERSQLIQDADALRAERNDLSKSLKGKPDPTTIEKVKRLKVDLETKETALNEVEEKWQAILDWMPNMPVSEELMPFGKGEEDNVVLKAWTPEKGEYQKPGVFETKGMPARSKHWDEALKEPKHHLDLGQALGVIDTEQSAKVSGSRFAYLKGDLVLMQYALQRLIFDELIRRGFTPIIPPLMVRDRALYGTSHFPEQRDQVYQVKGDYVEDEMELNLVGSSEPTNFAYFMDKTLNESELPQKVFAYTPCFRSEVGSWGKDVRGIKRVHQFDKIEMNAVCAPSQSEEVFNEFLAINEWLWQALEIPYQLVLKCTGDAGYHASAHQIDPEGWLPSQQEFMELGTDTNTTDFQARRLNIKYRTSEGDKKLCHTVNDTCIAMGRALIAIMDNYQQSDGTIKIPELLKSFIGKDYLGK